MEGLNEYLKIFKEIEGNKYPNIENYIKYSEKGLLRKVLIKKYAFAVPNEEAIKEIIKYSPLIEIGAGTGYWAYLINKYEGDIIAFDNNEWKNYFKKTFYSTKWFDVKFGVENQVKKYPERTLFLCWIDSSSKMGLTCLKLYTGTYFIHIGESKGLCCATDSFFKYLNKKFQLVKDISIPQWHGCHDYLEIYKRK